MSQQRCLVFDIETFPILAYVWGLKDQNIALNQIKEDWSLAAWGAKWLDQSNIMYQDRSTQSERSLLYGIWCLLDKADIVITQNGKAFDSKKLNAKFIQYGMKPPKPYKHIDTYLLAKSAADFTSNKLEYLTAKLCKKYKKTTHAHFPGMSLWTECLKNNPKAWKKMRTYNIADVLSTEELYNHLKAWGPQNMPKLYFTPLKCSICGFRAQRRGDAVVGKTKVKRVQCQSPTCGKWGIESLPKEAK